MSTRRHASRALRPQTELLEGRRLLSKTVSGVDADGDTWVLKLIGPGDLRVTNQPGTDGNPVPLGQPAEINTITIGGADPLNTSLIGHVTKSATGDGKVFFQSLNELGGRAEGPVATLGVNTIDIPNFWLGRTGTTAPAPTDTLADTITIPDGVNFLRFGGIDTTFTPTGGTPLTTNVNFAVNLGMPYSNGTSIIVDKVITNGQPASTSSSGTQNPATQQSATILVNGRINTFVANEIDGNSNVATTPFRGGGGTLVVSQPDPATAITGDIGFIRVGGNATNFSVQSGGPNGVVSNYYVGGETNNVSLLAQDGSRNIYFGKGMDTVNIATHTITTLFANRGALNSTVTSDRAIGHVIIGGDVVNTKVLSGYQQNLANIFQTQTAPTTPPATQDGGSITNVLIAGNVTNSIFAASVDPTNNTFGTPNELFFPHGRITAKIEGTINNATATPDMPNRAFYAKSVTLVRGPVQPPNVPEQPFAHPGGPPRGYGIRKGLQPTRVQVPNNNGQFGTTTGPSSSGSSGSTTG